MAKRKQTTRKENNTMNEQDASRIAREGLEKTLETGAETVRGVQEGFTSALDNVRDLNVKLIEMAQANCVAAFDFARDVAETKAPSDLVEVWTTHATKQFDRLTKQASKLTTLGQQFANKAETVTRRVAKR
jgi:hypothetical protein